MCACFIVVETVVLQCFAHIGKDGDLKYHGLLPSTLKIDSLLEHVQVIAVVLIQNIVLIN